MNKSDSIKELAGALSKAQGEFGFAKMNATNPFLKNKYADLGEVIQAVKPSMAKNGLSFTQMATSTDGKVGIETVIMHSSGEWISSMVELPVEGDKGRSLAQSMGAVITYLRRYALASALGIYADQDTDGDHTDGKKSEAQKTQPAQQTPPAQAAKPAPIPDEHRNGWTIKSAANFKTTKGTLFGDLTDDQLNTVKEKTTGDLHDAAGFLLQDPAIDEYDGYFELGALADAKGLQVNKLPDPVTRIQLWREMKHLAEVTR